MWLTIIQGVPFVEHPDCYLRLNVTGKQWNALDEMLQRAGDMSQGSAKTWIFHNRHLMLSCMQRIDKGELKEGHLAVCRTVIANAVRHIEREIRLLPVEAVPL